MLTFVVKQDCEWMAKKKVVKKKGKKKDDEVKPYKSVFDGFDKQVLFLEDFFYIILVPCHSSISPNPPWS